ncbi:lipopolysaccharide biosynthesis protein [Vibrio aestuarianus]|uniref:lipopolysaccharide biosynthesis protein n=1 Tax=Vibrio aestuarianus TaxID=28171 RepID=UPI00237CCA90|nr:oligosaccharide flippase family protein [Vibrio aestuarianus]MDE1338766.1 oligosaccharide flippase family protein [Vibrio aestuarianus]
MKAQISLKKNVIANYLGQGYKALIGIIMMPLYLSYLGSEAFGLIGFYIMLQSWMQLLDIGMKPTLARESAKYRAGSISSLELRIILRTLEVVFVITGALAAATMMISSNYIATSWLKVKELDLNVVSLSVSIMAIMVGVRWVSSLYNGVISGLEKQVWLNGFGIIAGTFRFVFVLIPFEVFGASIEIFFLYQLVVCLFEAIIIIAFTYGNFEKNNESVFYSFSVLKRIYKFSLAIAFGSVIWVLVTQIDKLILSKYISLDEYGYFSLAIVIANGLFVLGNAIGAAIMPRMTIYNEQEKTKELNKLYFLSIEIVLMVVVPISSMLVLYGDNILFFWTNDPLVAKNASEIMKWYVLGNVMVSMGAFAYYLQYAKGNLKLHVKGNFIYAALLIPAQIYTASHFGPIYTGIVWFAVNLLIVVLWLGVIHKKFLPGKHLSWLLVNIKMFIGGYAVAYALTYYLDINFEYELIEFLKLIFIGVVSVITTFMCSTSLKEKVFIRLINGK